MFKRQSLSFLSPHAPEFMNELVNIYYFMNELANICNFMNELQIFVIFFYNFHTIDEFDNYQKKCLKELKGVNLFTLYNLLCL